MHFDTKNYFKSNRNHNRNHKFPSAWQLFSADESGGTIIWNFTKESGL
jgi:hypothetical protein